ncbi:MAG: T9SS type A sorting domain-containing protein [Chitinophagaceae bacterium]
MKRILLLAAGTFLIFTANAQWQAKNPGFTNDSVGFYEISLPDKNTAWAVCYDGWFGLLSGKPILDFTRTIDGGNTWIPGKVGTDRTLRFSNISAIDGQEAWIAMHKIGSFSPATGAGFDKGGGGIFHTLDGGLTWEHSNPGELFNSNSVPRFVHFKDKNHGIAMGDPNGGYFEVYTTNNKGKKWKRVRQENLPAPLANEVGWISGHAVVGNTIWFGTSGGRMYKSIDFGKNWTVHIVDPLPGTYVQEIAFLDDGLRGVAHLRGRGRTFVFSTSDGGLTWTNYFQPANWKNSRMTAVPGTNAFISTAVHGNPIFQGSAVSYDVGQTWTEIDNDADKAACRFFDANTGYAGGFYITGHPVLGVGGLFKSEIVFQLPSDDQKNNPAGQAVELVKLYPVPANDVINVTLEDVFVNSEINILSADGRVVETTRSAGKRLVQLNVSKLPVGFYMVRITGKTKTINKPISIAR